MRILISITNLEVGGAQLFALNYANYLSEKHEIYIYEHRPEDRVKGFILAHLNNKIKLVSFCQSNIVLKVIWKLNKLIKKIAPKFHFRDFLHEKHFRFFLKRHEFDIIHSHLTYSDYTVAKCVPDNSPFVITVHGCYDMDSAVALDSYVIEARKNIDFILRKVKAVVYLTEKSKVPFIEKLPLNSPIIFKKIGNALFKSQDENKANKLAPLYILKDANSFIFGMVARGIREKGWGEAFSAFEEAEKILFKNNIKAQFVAVGGGDYLKTLKEKYSQNKSIIFVGEVPNALDYIAKFDVGILPSYRECFPNVIMEYIELDKPVIATRVGDIPYMVGEDNIAAGILINLDKNSLPNKEELKFAMLTMITDKVSFNHFKSNCLVQKRKFSIEQCINSHEKLYAKLKYCG